jgi:hypothetical protein
MSEPRVSIGNAELFTVRDAMRGLNRIVDDIVEGILGKAVLTRHGRMLCAVVPLGAIDGDWRAQWGIAREGEDEPHTICDERYPLEFELPAGEHIVSRIVSDWSSAGPGESAGHRRPA